MSMSMCMLTNPTLMLEREEEGEDHFPFLRVSEYIV
jgi:hypothetical protein